MYSDFAEFCQLLNTTLNFPYTYTIDCKTPNEAHDGGCLAGDRQETAAKR